MNKFKFLAAVFTTLVLGLGIYSCTQDEVKQIENPIQLSTTNVISNCPDITLFNFENIGKLHNDYLLDILTNANLDSSLDLTIQLNSYINLKNTNSPTMQEFYGGNPMSPAMEIITRNNLSSELNDFAISIINYLHNTNGILMNQEYQTYIMSKSAEANLLPNHSDKIKALRMLSVLSYSIDFWLPRKYCGQAGYSLVFKTNLDAEIVPRRTWLTNFADIFTHDCVGALFGGWSPPTAALGFAGASASRALGLAWDCGY